MKKIEARMIQAVRKALNNASLDGRVMKQANTEVLQVHHGAAHNIGYYREIQVLLYGHTIACVEPDINRIRLSDCGYRTVTTKSRLNALLGAFVPGEGISQRDFEWFTSQGTWGGLDEFPVQLKADNFRLQQAERLA